MSCHCVFLGHYSGRGQLKQSKEVYLCPVFPAWWSVQLSLGFDSTLQPTASFCLLFFGGLLRSFYARVPGLYWTSPVPGKHALSALSLHGPSCLASCDQDSVTSIPRIILPDPAFTDNMKALRTISSALSFLPLLSQFPQDVSDQRGLFKFSTLKEASELMYSLPCFWNFIPSERTVEPLLVYDEPKTSSFWTKPPWSLFLAIKWKLQDNKK